MEPIRKILLQITFAFLLAGTLSVTGYAADSTSQAGQVSIASGRLNVRNAASADAPVITALNKGDYITLISRSGSWWKVEYAPNRYGYCHGDYIRGLAGTPATVNTQSGNLNVRTGAGTAYAKADTLKRGEAVIRLSQTGDWSRILYRGTKTGYVSSRYLSARYAPAALWVQNMKQMDARWAHKVIGNSGKTIAQIGCATTAIAMLESHRTGIVRYPDEMMTSLRYTDSGSVYWPTHYKTVTDAAGYMNRVYALLHQGKPVLLGATNAYGSQHWVVITGFTGGNTITADKFTIQDPGSNSRTTLQQFLQAYPNFYKFFYY